MFASRTRPHVNQAGFSPAVMDVCASSKGVCVSSSVSHTRCAKGQMLLVMNFIEAAMVRV